jgi:hypothetical protein
MRVIFRIAKLLYSASQGVLAALGFYLLALIVLTVLGQGSIGLAFTGPTGLRATASLDSLTTGVNGMVFIAVFLIVLFGSCIAFTVFLLKWGRKLAQRMKHENPKLAKLAETATKEV